MTIGGVPPKTRSLEPGGTAYFWHNRSQSCEHHDIVMYTSAQRFCIGIHSVKCILTFSDFESFATEKLFYFFPVVKNQVKTESWHFLKSVLSLLRGVLNLTRSTLSLERLKISALGKQNSLLHVE